MLFVIVSDVLVKMPYVDGELPVYWWDSEADRCMVIGIFRHGMPRTRILLVNRLTELSDLKRCVGVNNETNDGIACRCLC